MSNRKIGTNFLAVILLTVSVWAQDPGKLGNAAFEEGRFAEAIEHYRQALDEKPAFGIHVNLGHSYMKLQRWPEAATSYEAAIELDPNAVTPDICLFLGQAHYQNHQHAAALEAFLAAASSGGGQRAAMWVAQCLIDMKQWVRAEAALSAHLAHHPTDRQTLELLAYVREQANDRQGTIEIYRDLATEAPGQMKYQMSLANALAAHGQTAQAIDTLELAWRLDRNAAEQVNTLLADLYLVEQMPHEAAMSYTRAIRAVERPTADDYFRLGMAYFQSGEFVSAKDAFDEMQKAEPNDFRADLYLGHCATAEEDPNVAEKHYRTALAKRPSSTEALLALAQLEMREERFKEAAAHFARVIQLGDGRSEVHYNHVLSLLRWPGQEGGAKTALKAALAQHPNAPLLQRLLDRYVDQTTQGTR